MWRTLSVVSQTEPELRASMQELLRTTLRNVVLAIEGIYFSWHIWGTVSLPDDIALRIWSVTPVVALAGGLTLWLLPRKLLAAEIVWLTGLAMAITLAVIVFRYPAITFLYTLLPLMGTITIGWPAGLASVIASVILSWGLSRPPLPQVLPSGYTMAIALGGGVTSVVGWAAFHTLHTVTRWSLFALERATESMEEARGRRAQLAKAVKDLDQAYYRLERANAALVAAWRAADEAEHFKTEFVTNLSHELRTPLHLIIGFSEMIMTAPENYGGTPIPGPYRSDLNTIYHNAQHLLALVNDVIDMARIDAAKIALARDQVDAHELVREAADMVRDYVSAKGLELQLQVAEDLPKLWVDRLRIRQVLLNLLVNAARFTERGWIRIEVSKKDAEIVVRVKDTGRGIPQEMLPELFEKFHLSDKPSSTGWPSGSGLGLPISKKLIELHGGRMGVESACLQGATFWFSLPCETSLAEAPPVRLIRTAPRERIGAPERIIIIVHEDPEAPLVLQRYLDGYRFIVTSEPQEALKFADEHKAVALLMGTGVELPDSEDGLLRLRCPLPSTRRAARQMGAEDLLIKPVCKETLWGAIDRLGQPVRRVLVVDDDPEVVRLFRRILRMRLPASSRLEAHNGIEALLLMRAKKPDLVLLDIVMPEMDGLEVLDEMRRDPQLASIPVIIVTGKEQSVLHLKLRDPIQVTRSGGLTVGEVTRSIGALLAALAPEWH